MNLIVVGAGGFGPEAMLFARESLSDMPGFKIKGFLDDANPETVLPLVQKIGSEVLGDTFTYPIRQDDRFVISIGEPAVRRAVADRLVTRGAKFASVIHPRAYVSPTARIGDGCLVGPQAIAGAFSVIEDHVLLNINATAGHDTQIGSWSVFSPYSIANGGARIGKGVFFGTYAAVMPNVQVGDGSKISAAAMVYHQVPANSLATGNPAKAFPLSQK